MSLMKKIVIQSCLQKKNIKCLVIIYLLFTACIAISWFREQRTHISFVLVQVSAEDPLIFKPHYLWGFVYKYALQFMR